MALLAFIGDIFEYDNLSWTRHALPLKSLRRRYYIRSTRLDILDLVAIVNIVITPALLHI